MSKHSQIGQEDQNYAEAAARIVIAQLLDGKAAAEVTVNNWKAEGTRRAMDGYRIHVWCTG